MILKKNGVKYYSIAYVGKEQVEYEMTKAKFGFCIREDIAINRVVTPTKLSFYVCNGVMSVYSACLKDFYGRAKDNPFCLCVDEEFLLISWIHVS